MSRRIARAAARFSASVALADGSFRFDGTQPGTAGNLQEGVDALVEVELASGDQAPQGMGGLVQLVVALSFRRKCHPSAFRLESPLPVPATLTGPW